jgi:hypothetical protein
VGYAGDVVLECTAAGPDPFTPVKSQDWLAEVRQYARESLRLLKAYDDLIQPTAESQSC